MHKLMSSAALAILAIGLSAAEPADEVVYKTAQAAPSGFSAWTFFWTMPELEKGATLQYVVIQPDGKEYYRRDVPAGDRPGQKFRADFSPGFAGGDLKVFYGKPILIKFIVSQGRIRFLDDSVFRFSFQTSVPALRQ
jgi:hypothetical protein